MWSLLLLSTPSLSQWVDPPPRYRCPDRPLFPCRCLRGGEDGVDLECSNTNLASLALGLRQVRTLVRELHIGNCNIETLYGSVFRLLTVKRMYIEDTPIKVSAQSEKGVS